MTGWLARAICWIIALFDRIPQSLISLAARIFPAAVFWRSGQTKAEDFHVTENAIDLFRDEYRLPLIDPASRVAPCARVPSRRRSPEVVRARTECALSRDTISDPFTVLASMSPPPCARCRSPLTVLARSRAGTGPVEIQMFGATGSRRNVLPREFKHADDGDKTGFVFEVGRWPDGS